MNLRERMNNLLIEITIIRLYSADYDVFYYYFWTERRRGSALLSSTP